MPPLLLGLRYLGKELELYPYLVYKLLLLGFSYLRFLVDL